MKYFSRSYRYTTPPENSHALVEIQIPKMILGEKDLIKLAEKKGFAIVEQIREGGSPPLVRLLRRIEPFQNLEHYDGLLKSMDRSLRNLNAEVSGRYVACTLPTPFDFNNRRTFNYAQGCEITVSFDKRNTKELLTIPDVFGGMEEDFKKNYFLPQFHHYRNKEDPEHMWNLAFKFTFDYYGGDRMSGYVERFKKFATETYRSENFIHRLDLTR
jgi:hypothetical protein